VTAYYNEIDPFAAQWLRNLIARNLIAPGDVDERSIVDVQPDDLRGYDHCHFFAGIGGWSLALRLAGWPDDRPVWTGSCPCQPFSVAGRQRGSEDERHLWPAFFDLIRECRPAAVFGEQVAGAAGLAWLDHVCADLEGAGYAAAAADLPACSVGAPHRRQRLWWVADDLGDGRRGIGAARVHERWAGAGGEESSAGGVDWKRRYDVNGRGEDGMGYAGIARLSARKLAELSGAQQFEERRAIVQSGGAWTDPVWLPCSDGKARPTQPGIFPLVNGFPGSRVGVLRAAGNAIVPQVAAEFIKAVMDCCPASAPMPPKPAPPLDAHSRRGDAL
jgi:DNA (cytosine-5)-methyltransferase 1